MIAGQAGCSSSRARQYGLSRCQVVAASPDAEPGRSVLGSGPNPMPEAPVGSSLVPTKGDPSLYVSRAVRTRFALPCAGRVSRRAGRAPDRLYGRARR